MQFSLDHWTGATCTHVSKRTENHGDALVHAKDLFWKLEGPNTMLDRLNPGLRPALYKHAGTKPLPGVEDITPELRTAILEGPFNVKYEGSGYMLTIKYGEVGGDQLELSGVELAKVKVDPREGGTTIILFRTSHTGLTMEQMGRLDTFDGKDLSILLAPPTMQTGTPSRGKGKKGKAEKDTKTAALPFKYSAGPDGIVDNNPTKAKDATEIFAEGAAPAAKTAAAKKPKPAAKKVAAKKTLMQKGGALAARERPNLFT